NMLLAARDQGVKRFVYASLSSVYGDSAELPKREGMEGCLLSPYAVTKATNELNAQNFYTTYGLPTIGLRYFNVFGKRQDPNSQYAAVMPLFVKALLDKKSPTIFGNGKQSRDFTHVDNVIEANIRSCLAGEEAFGKAFNIGCSAQHYLIDVYNMLCDMMGISLPPQYTSPRDGDITHSHACIELASRYLGYVPQTQLKEGLEKSIAWYKANL
ncbi:MAG: NAD-dependent epimerase/dehydratase family protein, partial [Alphaproteobacteria bacterium]|nr:NAD-dependent epimerase/dehydratase family protein [Alphaproteobacteria bacterium]